MGLEFHHSPDGAREPTYGSSAPEALIVDGVVQAFITALQVATDPAVRTSATVASKDAAKAAMLDVVRPIATRIKAAPAVSDADKIGIGVGIRDLRPDTRRNPNDAAPLEHRRCHAAAT